jgi:hypothetical protein
MGMTSSPQSRTPRSRVAWIRAVPMLGRLPGQRATAFAWEERPPRALRAASSFCLKAERRNAGGDTIPQVTERALFLAVPVAALSYATFGVASPSAGPGVSVTFELTLLALLALGTYARWKSVAALLAAYALAAIIHEAFFWHDNLALTGIDDIPPVGGAFLTVPVLLLPVAVGAAGRSLFVSLRTRQTRR